MSGGAIDLVRRDHHRQRHLAAQEFGDLVIAGAQAGLGVHHHHDGVGIGKRRTRLVLDLARELVAVVEVDPAGVDQRQPPAVPVRFELLAVARHPRLLVHDGLPGLGQPVHERGLADVLITDNRNFHRAARLADSRSGKDSAR